MSDRWERRFVQSSYSDSPAASRASVASSSASRLSISALPVPNISPKRAYMGTNDCRRD